MLKTFQMLRMTGSERMLREKDDEIWYQEIDTGSIKLKKFTKSYKS